MPPDTTVGLASIADIARAGEPDRYLAATLCPDAVAPHLIALAAFAAELRRIPEVAVREPMMGQMRLQWWHDALAQAEEGNVVGQPVADALGGAMRAGALPRAALQELADAFAVLLDREPFADERALRGHLRATDGTLFRLAAGCLSPEGRVTRAVTDAAGEAYGLARLLFHLPHAVQRGIVPLPQDLLTDAKLTADAVRSGVQRHEIEAVAGKLARRAQQAHAAVMQHVAHMPRETRLAFLPLALVGRYLRAVEDAGTSLLRSPPMLAPWRRAWLIARAAWFGVW